MDSLKEHEDFLNELDEDYFETRDFRDKVEKSVLKNMHGRMGIQRTLVGLAQDTAVILQDEDPDALKNFMSGKGTVDDLKNLGADYLIDISKILNSILKGN